MLNEWFNEMREEHNNQLEMIDTESKFMQIELARHMTTLENIKDIQKSALYVLHIVLKNLGPQ